MVTNTGDREGTETVQLYIRDVSGSVVRPVRELKGFEKITLKPGESRKVSFEIIEPMLRFWRIDMTYGSEPGKFEVYIGGDSTTENKAEFDEVWMIMTAKWEKQSKILQKCRESSANEHENNSIRNQWLNDDEKKNIKVHKKEKEMSFFLNKKCK